ncbi:MAG: histone deacetylase [Cyanobacteria bacterium SZAS LIN-3]|nr:histone deacetylase [Cyanobacteria bacterium SZAS LIN-3]
MSNKIKKHLVYSLSYQSDLSVLGSTVSFAQDRGARILDQLAREFGSGLELAYQKPRMVTLKEIKLAHCSCYLSRLKKPATWAETFGLTTMLPDNDASKAILTKLLNEYRVKCGGTLLAARKALDLKLAVNLGAGYHHAHRDHGDGFCMLNDIAIAIRTLQAEKKVERVMVVDTDFHHGNGTASIFKNDKTVFTLDVYARDAWPFKKEPCSLAVPISVSDAPLYLEKLKTALDKALARFKPDLVIYVQGADTWEASVLNRGEGFTLPLSVVQAKDELVIDTFAGAGIPLALVLAGGYGDRAWEGHYHGIKHLLFRAGALSES